MISYVLPTHNRQRALSETLDAIGSLARHDANVVVVDNASTTPATAPSSLANALHVEVVRLKGNIGTAARNTGVRRAVELNGSIPHEDHWIVMLDDDSAPVSGAFLGTLARAGRDIAVVAAEVVLPPGADGTVRHEAGGLPEVFIGCGAAIRASVFEGLGGYDKEFDYYAEEYDFSARVLLAGMRVVYDRGFVVDHRKVSAGRDMGRIIGNLVRNNCWVMARYAPDEVRSAQVRAQIARYAGIARKEQAFAGYLRGLMDVAMTLHTQPRRPMDEPLWRRFTGLDAAMNQLRDHMAKVPLGPVAIVERGKNAEVIEQAAREQRVDLVSDSRGADTLLIGTLSPGPMLDAVTLLRTETRTVVAPWSLSSL